MKAKEMYLKRADALHYAKELAEEIGGFVSDELSSVDNNNDFDYVDRDVHAWSGETPAFQVIGEDGSLVALYGFFE